MCGRYALRTSTPEIARILGIETNEGEPPRYNVAPTQIVPIFRHERGDARQSGALELAHARWGLIPSWAKDAKMAFRMINARAETVATKPAFRAAYRARRCLVPVDGYYEWRRIGGIKQPYLFEMHDRAPFFVAGLWERWKGPDGAPVDSCTLLTTGANALCAKVHDRMPVILPPHARATWMDPALERGPALAALLVPHAPEPMTCTAVSTHVNNARHEDAGCVEPSDDPAARLDPRPDREASS